MAQPMYRQIADDLRSQIDAGDLPPGAQLPTEYELQHHYAASRNTIRDAIKLLISLNLVRARAGQGTFVTRKIDPFVTTLSADPESGFGGGEGTTFLSEVGSPDRVPRHSTPRVEIRIPPQEIATQLGVTPDTQVISRQQERYIDDEPWSLQTSFYPFEFASSGQASQLLMAQHIESGTTSYLEQTLGIRQVGYRDWITMRVPGRSEQAFFGLTVDATVYEIFRTAYDQDGTPMRVTVTVFPADRNQFIIKAGPQPETQPGLSQA